MIELAVLGGGISAEHDVSVRSATEVLRGLDRARYRVWPVFIARDGAWHAPRGPVGADGVVPQLAADLGPPVRPGLGIATLLDHGVQLVFPCLHGRGGEDGTLQGMLELHRVPCVGSGTAASAVAMDKIRTRECLVGHGVPMAPAVSGPVPAAADHRSIEDVCARIVRDVGLPCFLKMDLSGSSFGVARCDEPGALRSFFANEAGRRFVAEARILGEEISVPVLGNAGGALRALPPVGIYVLEDAFFDVRAKYEPGRTEEVVPPRGLDAAAVTAVQELAKTCHTALGCDGVSRTDMIVTRDGPFVLEVNTLPGMTQQSLLPKCAAAAGIGFGALLDELIALALELDAARGPT